MDRYESTWYIVVIPLHSDRLCREQTTDVLSLDWNDTRVKLPADAPALWTNCLSGTTAEINGNLSVQVVLRRLPVALLRSV